MTLLNLKQGTNTLSKKLVRMWGKGTLDAFVGGSAGSDPVEINMRFLNKLKPELTVWFSYVPPMCILN